MSEDVPLVTFASLADPAPRTVLPRDTECSFIGMDDISESGQVIRRQGGNTRNHPGYTSFQDEDVLFAKITPCMENGKGALAGGLTGGYGIGSTEFHVLRARPNADPRFVHHWTRLRDFRAQAEAMMTGSAGQRRVPRSFFEIYKVPLVPLAEQRRIAEILDTVDENIRSTERLIAKLEQTKQGILHDILDFSVDDAVSGWTMYTMGDLLQESPKNGYSPQAAPTYTGKFTLGLGCLTLDGFKPVQLKYAPDGMSSQNSAVLREGDLLVSRANTRELVGLAGSYKDIGAPCIYPDLMMRMRPRNIVSSRFLELTLRSPYVRRQMQAAASGTSESMVKINSSIVKSLRVGIPDPVRQEEIVSRADGVDMKINRQRTELTKLRKLKQGLMDDLLTGKVRVNVDEAA